MKTVFGEPITRVLVVSDIPPDAPQPYTVCVKDESDWEEVHNYIVNENEIDGIPNRKIECVSDFPFSPKRSVYNMSLEESEVLKTHPKIEWVEKSSLYNQEVLEQRKYDEEFDRHVDIDRFKQRVVNRRTSGSPGTALTFTQWGLYRHQSTTNNFGTSTTISSDVQYSLSGKHVDVVIMDTGVRWDHPEFLKPGYTSVPVGVSTISVTRVRDILLHGPSEYGFSWSANGLTAPGSGLLANYNEATALNSSSFNGSWHGSHVAGTSAGSQFGLAFEANIWSIACIDRSDLGWAEPSDGFDYIRVWHNNKPINPITGVKNPTIVNCSWGHRQFIRYDLPYTATFRGTSYSSTYTEANGTNIPAIYWMDLTSSYYEFTTRRTSGQTQVDELLDDPGCQNVILICSAGNSGNGNGKQDISGGLDHDNQFTSGTFLYSSGYDNYYCRSGTPALGHIGKPDAVIKVGSIDSTVVTSGVTSERKGSYSNTGPAIDVWSAGTTILSPWSSGYSDPRSVGIATYYNDYLSGTSMASPNVTGVVSLYLQTNPKATRVDVRNWLDRYATINVGTQFLDQWTESDAVGINSVSYWRDSYGLRGANHKILYNPYANNVQPSISGVQMSGILFTQS